MGQVKIRLDDLLDQRLQRLADADRKPKATLAREILEDTIPHREMRIERRLDADAPEPAKIMNENLTEMSQRMADLAAHQAGDRRLAMEIYRVALQASVLAGAVAVDRGAEGQTSRAGGRCRAPVQRPSQLAAGAHASHRREHGSGNEPSFSD